MYNQDWQEPLKFDWFGENGPPITEEDIYNSEIGRILRNEFEPPFQETEYVRKTPWWNPRDPFGKNPQHRSSAYIPGKQEIPPYPQLSALTKQQHLSGLRVLTFTYSVQPWDFPAPEQEDFGVFEGVKELYEKELKEYRIWARMCWLNGDCTRTLLPKPLLETVYDAQFKLKKNEIQTLPHNFTMAAQISLGTRLDAFELIHKKDLKTVDVNSLPVIDYPDVLERDISVLQPYAVPKPCKNHSSRFILPYESCVSVLPLTDVQKELAQYAMQNGADCIASENALQCLQETERSWMLPLSVVDVICPEGGGVKAVLVIGSEFCVKKESAAMRTFKAYRHLLRHTFSQSSDIEKASCSSEPNRRTVEKPGCSSTVKKHGCSSTVKKPSCSSTVEKPGCNSNVTKPSCSSTVEKPGCSKILEKPSCSKTVEKPGCSRTVEKTGCSSTKLEPEVSVSVKQVPQEIHQINFAGMYREIDEIEASDQMSLDTSTLSTEAINDIIGVNSSSTEDINDVICDITCTCKGTTYEFPPQRSFKKWQVKNATANRNFDLIIHSAHKVREHNKEMILEPIVEWQPELGACKQSAGRVRALALSLMIRPDAELLNFRLDYNNGNIIVINRVDEETILRWHGDKRSEIADRIHTAIDQLRFLKQGQYILKHDPCHGANAMLYSTQASGFVGKSGALKLSLRPESDKMTDEEETALAKNCPQLSRAMLPYHKDQGILPLAFTPNKNHVKGDKKFTEALARTSKPTKGKKKNKKKKKKQPANA